MKIYSKEFRQLAGKSIKLTKTFPSYRQGFNVITKKMESFIMKDGNRQEKFRDGTSFVMKDGKPDFKLHKKVYDVELVTENPVSITKKDTTEEDNKFNVTLSAHMIWDILKSTIAFGEDIPQDKGRDKFDWEESYMEKLPGTYFMFSVSGEGIGTKYTFKEWKVFGDSSIVKEEKKETSDDNWWDDLPFN